MSAKILGMHDSIFEVAVNPPLGQKAELASEGNHTERTTRRFGYTTDEDDEVDEGDTIPFCKTKTDSTCIIEELDGDIGGSYSESESTSPGGPKSCATPEFSRSPKDSFSPTLDEDRFPPGLSLPGISARGPFDNFIASTEQLADCRPQAARRREAEVQDAKFGALNLQLASLSHEIPMSWLRGPPGLTLDTADVIAPPLSIGSVAHATMSCKPCAWFWKPGSCLNGLNCHHCHLCPEGTSKERKRAKQLAARSELLSEEQEHIQYNANAQIAERPSIGAADSLAGETICELPSIGSWMHGTGDCRPCAWFWRSPTGCGHGKECGHCHLCPEGELKVRRKAKMAAKVDTGRRANRDDMVQEPLQVEKAQAPELKKQLERPDESSVHCFDEAIVSLPDAAYVLPSIGSNLHFAGMCKPCAWYWKPSGCINGQDCHHCHLCPEGEIGERKKVKAGFLHAARSVQEEEEEELVAAKQVDEDGKGQLGEAAQGQSADQAFLPSVGSSLHSAGKCKPCAWFWKQQSCQNGSHCLHCHLCPDGENKARKSAVRIGKAMESAMRIGALEPAVNRAAGPKSPYVLRIAPLL